jgi:hypothetical protein
MLGVFRLSFAAAQFVGDLFVNLEAMSLAQKVDIETKPDDTDAGGE